MSSVEGGGSISNNNDELISQFMAFTGSSDGDKAASYLEMSGNNVETAVGLFLEHEQGGGGLGSNNGGGRNQGGTSDVSRMNRRGGGASGPPPPAGGGMMDDDVRAPDQTRTMRLMDDDVHSNPISSMMMAGNPAYQLMTAMMDMEEQMAPSAFASSAAAMTRVNARAALNEALARQSHGGADMSNFDEKEDDDDDDDDDEDYSRPQHAEPPRLSDMFAAPVHLIHRAGGFQGARTMAKDSKRWLLVNIQQDSVFASHALNRDVWRDELVDNLIREGFIFWQQVCIHVNWKKFV
jgi:UBX domain-containing protein 7